MEDKKDKSERSKYLNQEKENQEKRRDFYNTQLKELKDLIKSNQKEIQYNEGWINFHKNSVANHKKKIEQTADLNEKIDQEKKTKFHIEQIENHHKETIGFHEVEVKFIKKQIRLFEEGIKKSEKQLIFLNRKIEENKV